MKDGFTVKADGRELSLSAGSTSDLGELCSGELICFPDDPWTPEMFIDALQNLACTVYIAKDMQTSKMVGYCVMYYAADEADLTNIAVLPEYRRRGYGASLLTKILEISGNSGTARVFLEVRESNEPAKSMYKALEFAEIGKRRNYYRNPRENAIVMMKILDDSGKGHRYNDNSGN